MALSAHLLTVFQLSALPLPACVTPLSAFLLQPAVALSVFMLSIVTGGGPHSAVSISADSLAIVSIATARIAPAGGTSHGAVSTSADSISTVRITTASVCHPAISLSAARGVTEGGPCISTDRIALAGGASLTKVSISAGNIVTHGPIDASVLSSGVHPRLWGF
ncbi:UNVERIFIED_CONTAM: hypothetical protein FKN15_055547 [Acipenser sinensis]